MFELSTDEKETLKIIADMGNKNISRRAMIILMTEADQKPENIAAEVDLTVKVVKRWQREFLKKRLGIFPDQTIAESSANVSVETLDVAQVPEHVEQATVVAESKSTTKPKPVKSKQKSRNSAQALLKTDDKATNVEHDQKTKEDKKEKAVKLSSSKDKPSKPATDEKKIGLEPTDTMAEAGRKVLAFYFESMVEHEPGTRLGEDIEALHDMRVATRRMRATFNVFGDAYKPKVIKPLLEGLKQTGRALGPVRDLDVFLEKLQHYHEALSEEGKQNLQPLIDILQTRRNKARRKMMKHLDSSAYRKFKKAVRKFVKSEGFGAKPVILGDNPEPNQLRHVAPTLIYGTYAKVRAYETVLDGAPINTLHQLRIASKRLRYTVEYLEEILGAEAKQIIEDVKTIQDHLGDLNDAAIASSIVQEIINKLEKKQPKTKQDLEQIKVYLQAKHDEQHELLISFPAAWERFNRPKFRTMLAKSIAVL
ncbi:MAG: CHAD domain-containing protein [Anaerolineae bacterium]|nr:CHAD domain-containing protein [Anaerolineae bacterium]